MQKPDNSNFDPMGGTSKEIVYLMHILNILDKIQLSFDSEAQTDPKKALKRFSLYVQYLQNCIISDEARAYIQKTADTERKKLEEQFKGDNETINYMLGFVTIREAMKYLNNICEFEHINITSLVNLPKDIVSDKMLDIDEEDMEDLI